MFVEAGELGARGGEGDQAAVGGGGGGRGADFCGAAHRCCASCGSGIISRGVSGLKCDCTAAGGGGASLVKVGCRAS